MNLNFPCIPATAVIKREEQPILQCAVQNIPFGHHLMPRGNYVEVLEKSLFRKYTACADNEDRYTPVCVDTRLHLMEQARRRMDGGLGAAWESPVTAGLDMAQDA